MERKYRFYTNLIKVAVGIILAAFLAILLSQYITMAQLDKKQSSLDAELLASTKQQEDLNNQYNDINDNYDDFVENYVRDNYDYTNGDDILINK